MHIYRLSVFNFSGGVPSNFRGVPNNPYHNLWEECRAVAPRPELRKGESVSFDLINSNRPFHRSRIHCTMVDFLQINPDLVTTLCASIWLFRILARTVKFE